MRVNYFNMRLMDIHSIYYRDMIQKTDETLSTLAGYLEVELHGLVPIEGDLKRRLPKEHKAIHQFIDKLPEPMKRNQWKGELSQEEVGLIEDKCRK